METGNSKFEPVGEISNSNPKHHTHFRMGFLLSLQKHPCSEIGSFAKHIDCFDRVDTFDNSKIYSHEHRGIFLKFCSVIFFNVDFKA